MIISNTRTAVLISIVDGQNTVDSIMKDMFGVNLSRRDQQRLGSKLRYHINELEGCGYIHEVGSNPSEYYVNSRRVTTMEGSLVLKGNDNEEIDDGRFLVLKGENSEQYAIIGFNYLGEI